MSFVASEEAFPNGLKFKDPSMKGKTQEELSRELFPNLYRLMEESTVFSNFHSKEKRIFQKITLILVFIRLLQ